MKRIIHIPTSRTTWRGPEYIVDGVPGVVDAPDLVLATEIVAERPEYDPATHKLVRIEDSIENRNEWHMGRFRVVDLTPEEIIARTVPSEQPAWRIRAVAKLTPYGEGTLHDAVLALIAQLDDPQRTVAAEIYGGGNLLLRESTLLKQLTAALQLPDSTVHQLFIAADQLPT